MSSRDNWERLVAAVVRREQLWQLFHEPSRSPSICSVSSDDLTVDSSEEIPDLKCQSLFALSRPAQANRIIFKWGRWLGRHEKMMWSNVRFEHPATFDTLAMDPNKKNDIMNDLIEFTSAKDYYRKIGKPWKKYLLYGPPGTGKSTLIAAMANFLRYDVYDLELTAVRDNTHLLKLMTQVSQRAIVVIEDIDCALLASGKRKGNKIYKKDDNKKKLKELVVKKSKEDDGEDSKSKVTLSGLSNFLDGLWSTSGGERIFVFTTNYIEKIDEALIRRGRVDKHIEMSYCCFEGFKILAKNYLNLDSHEMFEKIRWLLAENNLSPADVAENLMLKSAEMSADECLDNLITALHKAKKEAENGEAKKLEVETKDTEYRKNRYSKVFPRLKTRIRLLFSQSKF